MMRGLGILIFLLIESSVVAATHPLLLQSKPSVEDVLGTQLGLTKDHLETSWKDSRPEVAFASADDILKLNLAAANTWAEILSCANGNLTKAAIQNYISGVYCPGNPSRTKSLLAGIRELHRQVQRFSESSWIGGNDSTQAKTNPEIRKVRLGPFHPFLAQMVIERLSIDANPNTLTWGWGGRPILTLNKPIDIPSGDERLGKSRSEQVLSLILLLSLAPDDRPVSKGGLFPCGSLSVFAGILSSVGSLGDWRKRLGEVSKQVRASCGGVGEQMSYEGTTWDGAFFSSNYRRQIRDYERFYRRASGK